MKRYKQFENVNMDVIARIMLKKYSTYIPKKFSKESISHDSVWFWTIIEYELVNRKYFNEKT